MSDQRGVDWFILYIVCQPCAIETSQPPFIIKVVPLWH